MRSFNVTNLFFFIQGGRNFSSSQPRPQPPDNRTIESFLEAYVDNYMSEYYWGMPHNLDLLLVL